MKNNYFKTPKTVIVSILVVIVGIILIVGSCIEEYIPTFKSSSEIIVIEGSLLKGDSQQVISISLSSKPQNPAFIPVSDAEVKVIDSDNISYSFNENEPGKYSSRSISPHLSFDKKYQLLVTLANGTSYISDSVQILESSPVEDIYYEISSHQSSSEGSNKGLQFYVDLKAPESATKNYRWVVEETYEIHTYYDIFGYYDKSGDSIVFRQISDSITVCWKTEELNEVYISTTANLVVNEKKKIPLNYINDRDSKLNVKYSILVKQYPLTNEAYQYWNNVYLLSRETGGLYQNQPNQSITNIKNVTNPEERVLGFFWGSSYSEKRLFFTGPLTNIFSECDLFICTQCNPEKFMRGMGYPRVYFTIYNGILSLPLNQECIDCSNKGGTIVKPDFWE